MSKGIDIPIDALITDFTNSLWIGNICQFYGRVYRNEVKDGYRTQIQPIYYINHDGIDVLKDDRKDAQCFVDVMPIRKFTGDVIEAEVRVLFMVNMAALYPLLSRSDAIEQVMADVKNELLASEFEITQMVSSYEAFSDYKWEEQSDADTKDDHVFRFDLKLIYINE